MPADSSTPYLTSEDVAFARTPGRDIFGKLDDRLPEVRIPFEVRQDAERAAHESGCGDLTTWMRELIYASLYAERARRVLGNAVHTAEQGK